ncbi:anti-sigma F factor antagonist SpoIIAA [Gottschalkia acidurici 9a]|uniref:Anti-sigma factor antagonist n=1 Tax=Gottschalkia acidurici (strain ATCC 7906 / DSM 604 / BCRC 14475 / CIP 104303 / KCTC 5404 / NCIMB 10678 / 9a) TaxID=1128398 RepID=K0AT96_GOTA9|nr:STAS domain-containing protein [Gottschalkia acidurici]AFS77093.1 anti-sigma F factor antagonist SpoIIAA [Gottschalkia acidurici 9a]
MGLEILKKFDKDDNQWVVSPIGEIDIYTSDEFKNMLLQLVEEEGTDITIVGDSLEYIDSTGLGVLISILKKLKESNNTITITNIKPSIKKLLELTSLDKVFIIKE